MNKQRVQEMMDLMEKVEAELEKYKGEEIVAGEHPLHKAVVELEHLCVKRESHDRLPLGVQTLWYQLLQVSRHGTFITGSPRSVFFNSNRFVFDNPDRKNWPGAMAFLMQTVLRGSRRWLELVLETDGNLPKIARKRNE